MTWILALVVPIAAGCVHAMMYGNSKDLAKRCEIVLRYLCGGLFGLWLITAGSFHVLAADSVARYIGWSAGSPFQLELGYASIGLGLVALRVATTRSADLLPAWLGGSVLFLGAAIVHAKDMVANGNFSAGNAGPVFYVDILAPIIACTLWILSKRR